MRLKELILILTKLEKVAGGDIKVYINDVRDGSELLGFLQMKNDE